MIDFTKPLRTRDGRKVRILCTDRKGEAPIVGLIVDDSGESLWTWHRDGACDASKNNPLDLVNINEGTFWVNVYSGGAFSSTHATREAADSWAAEERLARIKVSWREGQFDK